MVRQSICNGLTLSRQQQEKMWKKQFNQSINNQLFQITLIFLRSDSTKTEFSLAYVSNQKKDGISQTHNNLITLSQYRHNVVISRRHINRDQTKNYYTEYFSIQGLDTSQQIHKILNNKCCVVLLLKTPSALMFQVYPAFSSRGECIYDCTIKLLMISLLSPGSMLRRQRFVKR